MSFNSAVTRPAGAICLLLLATAGAQTAGQDAKTIRSLREQSNEAIARRDVASLERFFTDDYVMVRGSGAFVPSKEANLNIFRADEHDPNAFRYRRITDKVELSTAASLAAEHGHWQGLTSKGVLALEGSYLAMWRKSAAGVWQIRSELFVVLACHGEEACSAYRATAAKK